MRHLSVPTVRAQQTIEQIRQHNWQSPHFRIHQIHEDKIAIPLSENAPDPLPKNIDGEILFKQPIPNLPNRESWIEMFQREVGVDSLSQLDDRLARGHEIIGDVMIQPVHKFGDGIPDYIDALIRAKMRTHPKIRLALLDYGVKGAFRVRDLEIAAIRLNEIIQGEELWTLPEELLSSETISKESGLQIHLDPRKVYYSSKLEQERLETTQGLLDFKNSIGRALNVCDLYCGVGPNLAHLFTHIGLTSDILANDLNPECIPYIYRNLPPLRSLQVPKFDNLIQATDKIQIANMDALELASNVNQHGCWDVLFVNLPHDSLKHLPHLIPLLRQDTPTLIRGWSILPTDELPNLAEKLSNSSKIPSTYSDISFKVRKQYGATKSMVAFWIRMQPI
tara:strand:+ start:249 stop:1427 length:1179 start_codon:yes stop_codon:yes gene_type:complete